MLGGTVIHCVDYGVMQFLGVGNLLYVRFPTATNGTPPSHQHDQLRLEDTNVAQSANIFRGDIAIHLADYGVMQILAVENCSRTS